MKLIKSIFEDRPLQWGLRGDPFLWQELKNSLSDLKENINQTEFEEELEKRFNAIIQQGEKQSSNDTVWFKNFPQIGMSGGSISLSWWQETGLPFIKKKYKKLNK